MIQCYLASCTLALLLCLLLRDWHVPTTMYGSASLVDDEEPFDEPGLAYSSSSSAEDAYNSRYQ
jgi:hypothetical protein